MTKFLLSFMRSKSKFIILGQARPMSATNEIFEFHADKSINEILT